MRRCLQTVLIGLMMIGSSPVWSGVQRESFDVTVPQAPMPVLTEGHMALIYELHLTNFATEPLLVRKLRVINPDNGDAIASFEGSDLANRFVPVGGSIAGESKLPDTPIQPGGRAILFVEFGVKNGSVPKRLQHEIVYAAADDNQIVILQSQIVAVDSSEPTVLGPPFRNGIWAAVHAPSWPRGHRRTTYTLS